MEIPTFKDSQDAIKFVKENFGNEEALKGLKETRDYYINAVTESYNEFKRTKDRKSLQEGFNLGTIAQCYQEAVEIMEKMPHWKHIWGEL